MCELSDMQFLFFCPLTVLLYITVDRIWSYLDLSTHCLENPRKTKMVLWI